MDRCDDSTQECRWHAVLSNASGFGLGGDSERFNFGDGVSDVVRSAENDEHLKPLRRRKREPESSDVHGARGVPVRFWRSDSDAVLHFVPTVRVISSTSLLTQLQLHP